MEYVWMWGGAFAGMALTLAGMAAVHQFAPINGGHWMMGPLSSMMILGWLGLTYARHKHGDVTTADGISSWFKVVGLVIVVGILGTKRMGILLNAGATEWCVAGVLAAVQAGVCWWLFRRLQASENDFARRHAAGQQISGSECHSCSMPRISSPQSSSADPGGKSD
jgi:hypothetical protein